MFVSKQTTDVKYLYICAMNCLHCGTETKHHGNKPNKYCNVYCKNQYHQTVLKKVFNPISCKICGNEFIPKSKNGKFCSSLCGSRNNALKRSKKPHTKKCKQCGTSFKPYTSLDKFCSANCRILSVKHSRKRFLKFGTLTKNDNFLGDKNPAYRNGMYTRTAKKTAVGQRLFTKNAKEIEAVMIEECGVKYCERCKRTDAIKYERHHIIWRSEKPLHPNLHDKENIYIVCVGCHNLYHKNKGLRDDLVEKRELHLIFGNDVLDKSIVLPLCKS